jgi:hypothetical protein
VSDLISLDLIGIRKELEQMATCRELAEVMTVIVDRIANFEALMEARFDQIAAKLDGR